MVFETILDPLFWPVLKLPPVLGLLIISFAISLIVTIVYKYTTNQAIMKNLREDIKSHQKKMKELRADPKKMMESQKKAMEANMQYMKHSLRPTLFTLIPILIIFGWLNSHYAYQPLIPGQDFNVSVTFRPGTAGTVELNIPEGFQLTSEKVQQVKEQNSWTLNTAKEGKYTLEFKQADRYYQKDVLITTQPKYEQVKTVQKDGGIDKIILGNKEIKPFGALNVFGWMPGWLATYIISQIIFSLGLKKVFNLY